MRVWCKATASRASAGLRRIGPLRLDREATAAAAARPAPTAAAVEIGGEGAVPVGIASAVGRCIKRAHASSSLVSRVVGERLVRQASLAVGAGCVCVQTQLPANSLRRRGTCPGASVARPFGGRGAVILRYERKSQRRRGCGGGRRARRRCAAMVRQARRRGCSASCRCRRRVTRLTTTTRLAATLATFLVVLAMEKAGRAIGHTTANQSKAGPCSDQLVQDRRGERFARRHSVGLGVMARRGAGSALLGARGARCLFRGGRRVSSGRRRSSSARGCAIHNR